MPPDSVPDVLHFVQPPNLSFRPIRAAIADSLEEDAAELTTDVCLAVACLADGKHLKFLAALEGPSSVAHDLRLELARAQVVYRAEIQAIRAITDTLTTAGLALGLPADLVEQRIIDKKRRELFAFPD